MRIFRIASAFVLGLSALIMPAAAQENFATFQSSDGRLAFRYPSTWQMHAMPTSDGDIRVFAGSGDYECQVWAITKASSANASAGAVRQAYTNVLSAEQWTHMVEPLSMFQGGVSVGERSVDTNGAWPVQHVALSSPTNQARGTLQGRPGLELMSLCTSYDDQVRSAQFTAIENSIASPTAEAATTAQPAAPMQLAAPTQPAVPH